MKVTIYAPFTNEQIGRLRDWQRNDKVHPLTCPAGCGPLAVYESGLQCELCKYKQNWAPAVCAELKVFGQEMDELMKKEDARHD